MAYDHTIADRIRAILPKAKDITEKRMFGGLAFLKHGRMAVGILKDTLIIKIPKEDYDKLLKKPGAEPMNFTGRIMKGFIRIKPKGFKSGPALKAWIQRGLATAQKLGPKTAQEKERARRSKMTVSLLKDVEAIINQFPESIRPIARKLRQTIRDEGFMFSEKAYPGWRAVGFRHTRAGYICGIFPQKDSVRLVFEHGGKFKDPKHLLEGTNLKQTRYMDFSSIKEIENMADHIGDFLRQALAVGYRR